MGSDFGYAFELQLYDLGEEIFSLRTSVSPFENRKIDLRCSLRILQLYKSPNSLSLGLMLFKNCLQEPHMHKPNLMYKWSRRQSVWCE